MARLEGKTGEQLDYKGHWCALVLWDIITDNDYAAPPAYDPCELAINLLDNDLANFYCLRAENKESLIEYGLKNQERVISVTYNDFLPKKGDMVCYLWDYDVGTYNWSHIGVVAEDYDESGMLSTIEGNLGDGDDPLLHSVQRRTRFFDNSVVGVIRLVPKET